MILQRFVFINYHFNFIRGPLKLKKEIHLNRSLWELFYFHFCGVCAFGFGFEIVKLCALVSIKFSIFVFIYLAFSRTNKSNFDGDAEVPPIDSHAINIFIKNESQFCFWFRAEHVRQSYRFISLGDCAVEQMWPLSQCLRLLWNAWKELSSKRRQTQTSNRSSLFANVPNEKGKKWLALL